MLSYQQMVKRAYPGIRSTCICICVKKEAGPKLSYGVLRMLPLGRMPECAAPIGHMPRTGRKP